MCDGGPPRDAALAEAQNAIRTSNYSSSEVRAPGHIRNKTVTAATQTPTIENHAGAREFDTEFPLFLLSNITTVRLSIEQIQLVIWRRTVVVVVNVLKGAEKLDFLERVDG